MIPVEAPLPLPWLQAVAAYEIRPAGSDAAQFVASGSRLYLRLPGAGNSWANVKLFSNTFADHQHHISIWSLMELFESHALCLDCPLLDW